MSWRSRSAPRPVPSDRRRPSLASGRPVGQIWVLTVVALAAVAVLGGMTVARLAALRGDQRRVVEQLVPAEQALSHTQAGSTRHGFRLHGVHPPAGRGRHGEDGVDLHGRLGEHDLRVERICVSSPSLRRRGQGPDPLRDAQTADVQLPLEGLPRLGGGSRCQPHGGDRHRSDAVEAAGGSAHPIHIDYRPRRAASAATTTDGIVSGVWIAGGASFAVLVAVFAVTLQAARRRQSDALAARRAARDALAPRRAARPGSARGARRHRGGRRTRASSRRCSRPRRARRWNPRGRLEPCALPPGGHDDAGRSQLRLPGRFANRVRIGQPGPDAGVPEQQRLDACAFDGKVAIVTGGARGQGEAEVRLVRGRGCTRRVR